MAKEKATLSEAEICGIIRKSVEDALKKTEQHFLLEMAYPRGIYKQKIDNVLPQILINWCLVHYCTITGKSLSKEHWKGELRGHLATAARYSIRKNDAQDKRLKALKEVWDENDFSLPNVINLTVYNKFYEEGIDTLSDSYAKTLIDCINGSGEIFDTILSRNTDTIARYVETI